MIFDEAEAKRRAALAEERVSTLISELDELAEALRSANVEFVLRARLCCEHCEHFSAARLERKETLLKQARAWIDVARTRAVKQTLHDVLSTGAAEPIPILASTRAEVAAALAFLRHRQGARHDSDRPFRF